MDFVIPVIIALTKSLENMVNRMEKKIGIGIVLLLALFAGCYTFQKKPAGIRPLPVIPLPVSVRDFPDSCKVADPFIIYYSDEALGFPAEYLLERLDTLLHISGQIVFTSKIPQQNGVIILDLNRDIKQDEGYELEIGESIRLSAKNPQGVFYGVQTLIQLFYSHQDPNRGIILPDIEIRDYPRFSWRGMHLDVSRHFFDKEFIKKYIDILALHKMNVFHWHLTDDQGWRIEIKKYPRLTEIGAWRADREAMQWDSRTPQQPGEDATYGGFYSQEDIREVVEYAAQRFITVVPEIEMPAHCSAALAAYPQFSCTGQSIPVPTGGLWPLTNLYCAGNDSSFVFLQDVLQEVMELFPSRYIHIGGDEADKEVWRKCPRCQARMHQEGLEDENQLQSYFIRRIEKFLNRNNRTLIGWDEILEGGLAENATVMSWRGMEGGIAAARMKHEVVMTPTSHCYFDYYQSLDREIEPLAIGGFIDLSKVYSYEPIPKELNKKESKFILGAQGNIWTEYILSGSHVEYMALPRMSALSEVVWTPAQLRDKSNFLHRLSSFLNLLNGLNINYHLAAPAGLKQKMVFIDSLKVELTNPYPFGEIWYTLEGSDPLAGQSQLYTTPVTIFNDCEIRAALFLDNGKSSPIKTAMAIKQNPLPASYSGKVFERGVEYQYFEGKIDSLDDFEILTFKRSGVIDQLIIPMEREPDYFGLILQGLIDIPETGVYFFSTISDDGSRLMIDEEIVVNNDGLHDAETVEGEIALEKGYHRIKVWYFESTGGELLEVKITGPGISERVIPGEMLFREKMGE